MEEVYLNANLIFSDVIPRVMKKWDEKPMGTLLKLNESYELVTSVLTKLEVMQNLMKRFNFTTEKARELYFECLERYEITEIQNLSKDLVFNSAFCDMIAKTSLELKDAMHLTVCKKRNFVMCTHDVKMRKYHKYKKKYYDKFFKPEELINERDKSKNA